MRRLRLFGKHWDALGENDPFGSILTGGGPNGWDVDDFFATGRTDVTAFIANLDRIFPAVQRGSVLDFGCGVGRLSRALAEHFQTVVGLDVADSMIRRAQLLNSDVPRCRFRTNRPPHLKVFADGQFDVVYSRLVLQHIPPRLLKRYIPELVRVTATGGALVFQLPGVIAHDSEELYKRAAVTGSLVKRSLPRKMVSAYRAVKYRLLVDESTPRMLMFGMEQESVVALVQRAGGRVVAIRPDEAHGTDVPGFEYWVSKEKIGYGT